MSSRSGSLGLIGGGGGGVVVIVGIEVSTGDGGGEIEWRGIGVSE